MEQIEPVFDLMGGSTAKIVGPCGCAKCIGTLAQEIVREVGHPHVHISIRRPRVGDPSRCGLGVGEGGLGEARGFGKGSRDSVGGSALGVAKSKRELDVHISGDGRNNRWPFCRIGVQDINLWLNLRIANVPNGRVPNGVNNELEFVLRRFEGLPLCSVP